MAHTAMNSAEISHAEQQFLASRFSLETAPDGIFWIKRDGTICYANERAFRSLGYTHDELLALQIRDIDPIYNLQESYEANWDLMLEIAPTSFETVNRRKDGTTFPVWIWVAFVTVGSEVICCCSVRDITKQKEVEQALREANEKLEQRVAQRTDQLAESEARYQDLYHNAPDMFASVDVETGQIVQCNRTLAHVTGHMMNELIGRNIVDMFHVDCRKEAKWMWNRFVSTGDVRGVELVLCRVDGGKIDVSLNMSAVLNSKGQITRGRSIFRDITDRKRAEQQAEERRSELEHVARLETLGEMAAGLAHELNQPLYALSNFARGATRRQELGSLDSDSLTNVLQDIVSESERAAEIIRSLQRYVGKRERVRKVVNPSEMIRRVTDLVSGEAKRRSVQFELQLDDTLPSVFCDDIQVEQVFLNLVLNGMEAMSDTPRNDRHLAIGAHHTSPGAVEFSVSDCGRGMCGGDAEKIFDIFHTTKEEGFGLGLAISRTIVQSHGGQLQVAPNAERGVTFRFTLPTTESNCIP